MLLGYVALIGQHTAAEAGPAIVLSLLLAALGTMPLLYCLHASTSSCRLSDGLQGVLRACWGRASAGVLGGALLLNWSRVAWRNRWPVICVHCWPIVGRLRGAGSADGQPGGASDCGRVAAVATNGSGGVCAVDDEDRDRPAAGGTGSRYMHYAHWIPWLPEATAPIALGLVVYWRRACRCWVRSPAWAWRLDFPAWAGR